MHLCSFVNACGGYWCVWVAVKSSVPCGSWAVRRMVLSVLPILPCLPTRFLCLFPQCFPYCLPPQTYYFCLHTFMFISICNSPSITSTNWSTPVQPDNLLLINDRTVRWPHGWAVVDVISGGQVDGMAVEAAGLMVGTSLTLICLLPSSEQRGRCAAARRPDESS